jgi:signal transduction histidine kinase
MAGSANEFLYLSEELRHEVETIKDNLMIGANSSSKRILFNNNIEAILAIAIKLLLALFLSRRILLPIKNITAVFRVLSKVDEIDNIPGTDRADEVGDLAKAAAVFHQNNKLTHELLDRSQDMIANQEVMNIQLQAEKDKAENAAKAKSMFLANMSHEIRTPMNGIVGLVDLVLKSDLNAKQKNYLNRIAYSGQIMMNVINDILDF